MFFVVAIGIPTFSVIIVYFYKLSFDLHISKFGRLIIWVQFAVNLHKLEIVFVHNSEPELEM